MAKPPDKPLERFTTVKIPRHMVKNAPYNPRSISDGARTKLKRGISKLGMLGPITWNVRTGNIVGGHQRVRIMDDVYGSQAYDLTVAQVDLSDKEEKEANLLLNNPETQGETELEKLGALLQDGGLDLTAAGYDSADMFRMFGDLAVETEMDAAEVETLNAMAENLQKTQSAYTNREFTNEVKDNPDFFLVVVFKDYKERLAFLATLGLPDNRFQDGRVIAAAVKPLSDQSQPAS